MVIIDTDVVEARGFEFAGHDFFVFAAALVFGAEHAGGVGVYGEGVDFLADARDVVCHEGCAVEVEWGWR